MLIRVHVDLVTVLGMKREYRLRNYFKNKRKKEKTYFVLMLSLPSIAVPSNVAPVRVASVSPFAIPDS